MLHVSRILHGKGGTGREVSCMGGRVNNQQPESQPDLVVGCFQR